MWLTSNSISTNSSIISIRYLSVSVNCLKSTITKFRLINWLKRSDIVCDHQEILKKTASWFRCGWLTIEWILIENSSYLGHMHSRIWYTICMNCSYKLKASLGVTRTLFSFACPSIQSMNWNHHSNKSVWLKEIDAYGAAYVKSTRGAQRTTSTEHKQLSGLNLTAWRVWSRKPKLEKKYRFEKDCQLIVFFLHF